MCSVPRWALISSGCAPVLLVTGWVFAAFLEGAAYDPVRQTISVLAAYGAAGFWVMTAALFALGVCHLITAWGLRPAARPGRLALACGGVAALAVALNPAPSSGGSLRHGAVAATGFVLLAAWPLLAVPSDRGGPWALRPAPALAASAVMAVGAGWYLLETQGHGAAGVAERFTTGVQALWPFVVVASCLRHAGTARAPERRGRP
ncbi:DUF998 domain-containing protein [Streptomyces sp. NBC_01216]|uniref:DUF998 domain-containing protein n=1 Tax=unclassified Streptomyces TaxID=2593676 RepID=UPI002E147716|nr:DUF998 domain-containing protein [Streptomyces sp. NBC_01216]